MRLTFPVAGLAEPMLHYSVPAEFADFLTLRGDAALVGLLAASMERAQDLHIEGEVSAELFHTVRQEVVPLLVAAIPGLHPIRITAARCVATTPPAAQAVLAPLSNGADSFCTVLDHLPPSPAAAAARITHVLFNETGSHGPAHDPASAGVHAAQAAEVAGTAASLGLALITPRTNLDRFYRTPYQQTHTLRNASVALALGGRAARYLYPSSYTYGQLKAAGGDDCAYIDPILLPLLSTETLRCSASMTGLTRIEKFQRICDVPVVQQRLNVCIDSFPNCSACWKCMRAMLILDTLGRLEAFGRVFDLPGYRRRRAAYVAHIHASGQPVSRDVAAFLRAVQGPPRGWEAVRAIATRGLHRAAETVPSWRLRRLYARLSGQEPNS